MEKNNKVLTRDFIERLSIEPGLNEARAKNIIKIITDMVMDAVIAGKKCEITGFGTFEARWKQAGEVINPRTKEMTSYEGRFRPHFTAGQTFKKAVKENLQKKND